MDQQAEPAKRALAFEPRDHVVGDGDPLQGLAEHELAWVQDERLLVGRLDQFGQILHRLLDVDERIARVVEDAVAVVDPQVDARGLDQPVLEGIDDDPAGLDLLSQGLVAQDHEAAVCQL